MIHRCLLLSLILTSCFLYNDTQERPNTPCAPMERPNDDGRCVPKCHTAAGESECGDLCCAADEQCLDGSCQSAPACDATQTPCGGLCCDTASQICYDGVCSDRTVDPNNDPTCEGAAPSNGSCLGNNDCQNDSRCISGQCVPFNDNESDGSCTVTVPLGVFRPALQCEWQPVDSNTPCSLFNAAGNPLIGNPNYPQGLITPQCPQNEVCVDPDITDEDLNRVCIDPRRQVLATPMVIQFDFPAGSRGNPSGLPKGSPSLVFPSYDGIDGGFRSASAGGVLRIVDGATCQTLYTIDGTDPNTGLPLFTVSSSSVAVGDLDGGRPEIIAHAQGGGLWAFTYDQANDRFRTLWHSTNPDGSLNFHNRGKRFVDFFGLELFDLAQYTGPALHNLDGGSPEILMSGSVFDSDGIARFEADLNFELDFRFPETPLRPGATGQFSVIADVDLDGAPEMVSGDKLYDWVSAGPEQPGSWVPSPDFILSPGGFDGYTAVADFGSFPRRDGTPDPSPGGFPEIVVVNGGTGSGVLVQTSDGQIIFGPIKIPGGGLGGPPTIGDFDGDGTPEFAVAGGRAYTVFDFDCATSTPAACSVDADCGVGLACPAPGRCSKSSTPCEDLDNDSDCPATETCVQLSAQRVCAPEGCQGNGFRWSQISQDVSSNRTGSSVFDFEADGATEAVYADECYTRVYDGANGTVLFSQFHTSCTWNENPIIADVDGDLRSEIVVGSNENCGIADTCFDNAFTVALGPDGIFDTDDDIRVDPIFPGLRCEEDADCPGGPCLDSLCRCQDNTQCGDQGDLVCAPVIPTSTSAPGNVCRAAFQPDAGDGRPGLTGIRVYRDANDRWANSRNLWNQHTYSVTNINDDGTIPAQSLNNWQVGLNNFRQNVSGSELPDRFPDLTSEGLEDCECTEGAMLLRVNICNRGAQEVGPGIPIAFYQSTTPSLEGLRCQTQTISLLPPGQCEEVSCEIEPGALTPTDFIVVVDDDGTSQGERAECREENNFALLPARRCIAP
jgi:hypothetical protein